MAQKGTLSANKRKALAALLSSTSVTAAAEVAGLSSRTLWRYLSEPSFAAELSSREMQVIEHGARWLAAELEATLGALIEIRDDESASQSVRLRACATLVSAMLDLRSLGLERRLIELEQRVFGFYERQGIKPY